MIPSSNNINRQVFFKLLRAGLWGEKVRLFEYKDIDFGAVYRLAQEQSVLGLVAAGLEHIQDMKLAKTSVLPFMGSVLQIEQRNILMNKFIAQLAKFLQTEGINAVIVKGQGIAQCYDKPLWRTSGDIDILLDEKDYKKAKALLVSRAEKTEQEIAHLKHLGIVLNGWVIELHGTMHSRLSKSIDKEIDSVQEQVLHNGKVRVWQNGEDNVYLPSVNEDIIFVFTHILHHFFIEGIGIRQICDWCRLIWTYRNEIDLELLMQRLHRMSLISEWKAFAAYAVGWLGVPEEVMPLYSKDKKWLSKAERIDDFVIEVGNFGHNRQITRSRNFVIGKIQSLFQKFSDFIRHAQIFPMDSFRFFCFFICDGIKVMKGSKIGGLYSSQM